VKWFSEDLFQKKLDQTISAAVSALYYPGQQGGQQLRPCDKQYPCEPIGHGAILSLP